MGSGWLRLELSKLVNEDGKLSMPHHAAQHHLYFPKSAETVHLHQEL